MLSAPVDLRPMGAQTRGNEPDRLQASSKIENSMVTTGSNNRCRSPWSKKLNPIKNLESHIHMAGAPRCVTKGEIVGGAQHIRREKPPLIRLVFWVE